jgi:hypothetical protein
VRGGVTINMKGEEKMTTEEFYLMEFTGAE